MIDDTMLEDESKFCDKALLKGLVIYLLLGLVFGQLLTSDVLSSARGEEREFPFVSEDLRTVGSSLEYISGPCTGSYDALAHIGVTPPYEGSNESTDKVASGASLDITRTCVEEGKCLVIDSQPLATEEKKLQGDSEHRTRITDTRHPFHRIHGHLIMKFLKNKTYKTYTGSGILVGPHHVLTAAHNLYDQNSEEWATEVFFAPGRNEGDYPYADSKGVVLLVHSKWIKSTKNEDEYAYDLGMVILDNAIGFVTGWSGLLSLPDILLREWEVSVTGYPGEKGHGKHYSTQMWTMSDTITLVEPEKLFYKIETTEGQSGSGIWGDKWPGRNGIYTVGIHTGTEKGDVQENRGVRLSQDKFKLILHWLTTYQLKGIDFPSHAPLQEAYTPKSLHFLNALCTDPILASQAARAQKEEKEALYQIGCLYAEGKDLEANPSYAFACFYRSAQQGYGLALTSLGVCYETGQGIEKNLSKAISLYDKAKNKKNQKQKGYEEAFRRLGLLYLEGKILPKKPEMAINHLEEARRAGDAEACFHLGKIYAEGKYVTQKIEKAEQRYAQAKKRHCKLTRESTRSISPLSKKERRKKAIASWKSDRRLKTTFVGYLPDDKGLFSYFVEAVPDGQEESYLVQLGNRLWNNERVSITGNSQLGISGLGGIGKSTLALRYAYLSQKKKLYDVVHWINAETQIGIRGSYKSLLKELEPFMEINDDTVIQNLEQALSAKTFLLIYDNVPVLYDEDIPYDVLVKLFPTKGKGHFLITSRRSSDEWDDFPLRVFSQKDSIEYLLKRTGLNKRDMADMPAIHHLSGEIGEEMGHLPLALKHAGAYLSRMKDRLKAEHFSEYLNAFKKNREELKGFEFNDCDESQKVVATTWKMTLDKTNSICHEVMTHCSFLNPDKIPVALLNPKKKPNIRDAIDLLSQYSMISIDGIDFISVHRLVQWVIRKIQMTHLDHSFFDKEMPYMIINYVQRAFTLGVDNEKIWRETLNVILHSVSLIGHVQQKNHYYDKLHHFLILGQVMSLTLFQYPDRQDPEKKKSFDGVLEKNIPVFFRNRSLAVDIGPVERFFKDSHPLIHYGIGEYYYRIKNYTKSVKFWIEAAKNEFSPAQFSLGYAYFIGEGITQNDENSVYWYKEAAKKRHIASQFNLGNAYSKGRGVEQNRKKAIKWWTRAAKQGYGSAQFNLGNAYDRAEDYTQAIKWWTMAAEQGHAVAQHKTGTAYYKGRGVKKNYEEAVKWWKKAAKQEYAEAEYQLGISYYHGNGVNKNHEEAVKWWTMAAEQGHTKAQFNLGNVYYLGNGVNQNYEEAVKWWTMSADNGQVDAQYRLGVLYHEGEGVAKDYKKSFKWYKKAAEQGHKEAQFNLGHAYYLGNGVNQNHEEAVKWWTMSADKGQVDAQYRLGVSYHKGKGAAKDYKKSFKWFKKAANQGHTVSQFNLGHVYYLGNHENAVKWYKKAAEQGDADAQYNLGVCYDNGNGVEENKEKAVEWYRKAANQGHKASQFHIGNAYALGNSVSPNHEEAVKWWTMAAEQGHAEAQFNLGCAYALGWGISQNYEQAILWWGKSAEQGHAWAQFTIKFLNFIECYI